MGEDRCGKCGRWSNRLTADHPSDRDPLPEEWRCDACRSQGGSGWLIVFALAFVAWILSMGIAIGGGL